jgi:hypothetical protein
MAWGEEMRRTTFTRVFALATAVLLLVSVMTPSPALARAGCSSGPLAGTADVTTQQFITTIANSTDLLDDVRLTNLGPCNVPSESLLVTLPDGANFVSASSNPSAWTCTPTGQTIFCSEQNTIGVPGTADIFIRFNPGLGSGTPVIACGLGGTDAALCPPGPTPDAPPDAFPGNNLSYAGLLGPGDSLIYGPGGDATPNGSFNHTTTVTLSLGGLVNIYQATVCPPDVPDCFLGTITINTTASGPKTWTLSFLASIATKSLAQITVWNSVGGPFIPLTSCNGKHATDPCVLDRVRSTNSSGDTVFTIIVQGTQDDGMTAD